MFDSRTAIFRTAFTLLLLATGLSAQRYTGHDHAVFHRQPQPPVASSKHQSSSPAVSGTGNRQKTSIAASASPQASHASAAQGKLEGDMNRSATPEKPEATAEDSPHF